MTTPALETSAWRAANLAACLALFAVVGGCTSSLLPKPPEQPSLYALNDAPSDAPGGAPKDAPPAKAATQRPSAAARPTLIVNPPRAAAGFDTSHIVYQRAPHQVEFFAFSQWVDTPAQMLAPLIVRAVERSGAFSAVLLAPTAATGQWRLDTEVVRLQQEFGSTPSQARFTLRAVLLDSATRRVIAVREFDASVPAPTEDAPGGVSAANLAVQRVLGELAEFAAKAAAPS